MIYEQFAEICKRIDALQKKNTGIIAEMETGGIAEPSTRPTVERRAKLYARHQVNLEAIADLKHELHCLAVVEGIADYNPVRYGMLKVEGPLGPTTVYRRDPFAENLEEQNSVDNLLPASVDNPTEERETELFVIEERRKELEAQVKNEKGLQDAGMENIVDYREQELRLFNEKYPPA